MIIQEKINDNFARTYSNKGAVGNHAISVTPGVKNITRHIAGGTKTERVQPCRLQN